MTELFTNTLELIAVVTGIAYVALAARAHISCWLFAFISSCISFWLVWEANIYMQSVLYIYYIAMAIYGWQQWRNQSQVADGIAIVSWRWQQHVLALFVITILALLSGTWLGMYTESAHPYIDSLVTWGAVITTWMVAKKILQNWLYWIVIDTVSIFLYYQNGLTFYTVMFATYTVIAAFGYYHWRQSYLTQLSSSADH